MSSTFTKEMHAANSRRGRDEIDETWQRVVVGRMPDEVQFTNRFTPLARMLNDYTPATWYEAELEVLGKVTTGLKTVAEGCIKEEYNVVPRPNYLRLNGTLPDAPELAEILGMVANPDMEYVVYFGTESPETKEWHSHGTHSRSSAKSKVTKEQRRRHVIDRITKRLRALENGTLGFVQWLLLSPATPAWKKVIIREMSPDGFLDVFGLSVSNELLFAITVIVAYKHRAVPCPMEAELAKKVGIAFENEEANPLMYLTCFSCLSEDCYGWLQGCALAKQQVNHFHTNMTSLLSAFAKFDTSIYDTDED